MDKIDKLIEIASTLHRHFPTEPNNSSWPHTIQSCICGNWEGTDYSKHIRQVARQALRDINDAQDPDPEV